MTCGWLADAPTVDCVLAPRTLEYWEAEGAMHDRQAPAPQRRR
jgi:hypothetical protein